MINLDETILEILYKMKQFAPTYLSAGYLRDKLLDLQPNDIDILTELTMEEVQAIIPNFQGTKKGLVFGVGRFTYRNLQFEVSSIADKTIEETVQQKDFVMNSLYHDGARLFDPFNAYGDIEQGIIRSLQDPQLHFATNPQAYLRAIRFCGQLGFRLDDELKTYLMTNPRIFFENNESRIQQEGYKIIHSRHPLNALQALNDIGLFPSFPIINIPKEILLRTFPFESDKTFLRFLLLSQYTGLEYIYQFIDHFRLTKQLKEQIQHFVPYLSDSQIPTNPHMLNTVILLKKYQHENDPDAFQSFLAAIRKQKNGQ